MSLAIKQALSPKAILLAMGGACLLYAGMLGLSLFKGGSTLDGLESKMAAQNIAFNKPFSQKMHHNTSNQPIDLSTLEDLSAQIGASKTPLPPAPYEGLTEDTQFGVLPMIGKNKLKPFDAYKKQYAYDVKKPVIAIGVTGIGFSGKLSENALTRLSPQVSLILSVYVDGINEIQKKARAMGYETWLELPFETNKFPYNDPGPKGILVNAGLKFNQDNFRSVLASTTGYAGIAGYTDSAFKDAHTMLGGILSDVFGRGLGFFEMNPGRDSMSLKVAINNRAAHVKNSIQQTDQSASQRFKTLKKMAKRDQQAIGIIEISPSMLAGFQKEILAAKEEGFEIVPLSVLVDQF